MKKFIYFSGIVFVNLFLWGAILKINHLTGGNILIFLGLFLMSVVFLPIAIFQAYRDHGLPGQQWIYISGYLCASVDLVGAMFKVLHYPGANWLLTIGIPLPFVLFLPIFVFYHIKQKEMQMKGFLSVMFLMTYIVVFTALLSVKVG